MSLTCLGVSCPWPDTSFLVDGCRGSGFGDWKATLVLLLRGEPSWPLGMCTPRAHWNFWAGVSVPEFGGTWPCSRPWGAAVNAQGSWGLFLHVLWEMAPLPGPQGSVGPFSLQLELLARSFHFLTFAPVVHLFIFSLCFL